MANSIFLVKGEEVYKNFSNVSSIYTQVIPNIGDTIITKEGMFNVKNKIVDYRQVEDYALEDEGRGGEIIYIFI